MFKKLISLVLCMAMMGTMGAVSAIAEDDTDEIIVIENTDDTSDEFSWEENDSAESEEYEDLLVDTGSSEKESEIGWYEEPAGVGGIALFAVSKPAQPTISGASPTTDSVTIKWSGISGATSYEVGIRKSGETEYSRVATTTNKSYTYNKLAAGTKYFFRLYSVNSAGKTRSETYSCYTKPQTPDMPVITRDSDSKLTVTWKKATGATKYQVWRRRVDEEAYTNIKTTTSLSFTDSGLLEASKYFYKIVAVIGNGDNGKSDVASARSESGYQYTMFSRPSLTKNTINPGEASSVTITTPKSYVPASNSYHFIIDRKAKGESQYTTVYTAKNGNVSKQTFTDKNVAADNAYTYIIRIIRESDNVAILSSPAFSVGPTMSSPTLKSTSASSVNISWKLACPETVVYIIQRKTASSGYATIATVKSSTSYVDTSVKVGETYYYRVFAHDSNGENGYRITKSAEKAIKHEFLPTSISLNKTSIKIAEGHSEKLIPSIVPVGVTNASITWSSNDESIANVDSNGMVVAGQIGTATITAETINGKKAQCSVEVVSESELCEHEYGGWHTDKEATCTEDGKMHRECSKCGNVEEEIIFALGHDYSEEFITVDATCTEAGEKYRECARCGDKIDHEIIEPIGHSFDEWVVEKQPTCVEEGSKVRTCHVCNESEHEIIDTIEHNYEVTNRKEPENGEDGFEVYTCSMCGDTYTKILRFPVNVFVGDTITESGKQVAIPINIEYNKGFNSFDLIFEFNKALGMPSIKTVGGLIADVSESLQVEMTATSVHTTFNSANVINTNGTLFYLEFNIPSVETNTKTSISIKDGVAGNGLVNDDENELNYMLINGDLEIIPSSIQTNSPKIKVSSATAKLNKEIELVVSLEDNSGFANLGIEFDYDYENLTLTKVTTNPAVPAEVTTSQTLRQQPFSVAWDSTKNVTYNGELAKLVFKVDGNAPCADYIIKVDYYKGPSGNYIDGSSVNYNASLKPIGLQYFSGNITVESGSVGDVNGDGSINSRDTTYLQRHLAGWNIEGLIRSAMDVDGNTVINNKDATILMRYLAGWNIELE